MKSVEVIGSEFYHAAAAARGVMSNLFPQLKEFTLLDMPKLKDWSNPCCTAAASSSVTAFPCLEELRIENCPSLVSIPSSCFHSLEELTMKKMNSSQPLLTVLSNSHQITSLLVENVHQLTHLSEQLMKCTSLSRLTILDCEELVQLPPTLQILRCLESWEVSGCGSLTSFPDIGGLLRLRNLDIVNCDNITDAPSGLETCLAVENLSVIGCFKLKEIPDLTSLSCLRCLHLSDFSMQMSVPLWISHLSSLTHLGIERFNEELENFGDINHLPRCLKSLSLDGWLKLKSLPDSLQSFTQLEDLLLLGFEGVIQLPEWLGNLSSLKTLNIECCESMKQLPSSAAMQSLTQLTELNIIDCPLLEERCRKDKGEERHKISHIPRILIKQE